MKNLGDVFQLPQGGYSARPRPFICKPPPDSGRRAPGLSAPATKQFWRC